MWFQCERCGKSLSDLPSHGPSPEFTADDPRRRAREQVVALMAAAAKEKPSVELSRTPPPHAFYYHSEEKFPCPLWGIEWGIEEPAADLCKEIP